MSSLYRGILKRAWAVSVRNKWLWVFGFFAAFLGQGSIYEFLLRSLSNATDNRSFFYTLQEYSQTGIIGMASWQNVQRLWSLDSSGAGLSILAFVVVCVFFALLIAFGVVCQGGLLRSAVLLAEGRTLSYKEGLRSGLDHFWRILGLNVITKIALMGILMLLAFLVAFCAFQNQIVNLIFYILFFSIFIILSIIVNFFTIYGSAYIVLRKKTVFGAMYSSWNLFYRNALVSIEMGLILFVVNVAVLIGFVVAVFVAIAPFLLLYFILAFAGARVGSFIVGGVMALLFFCITFLVGSWYSTFQLSCWAVLFEELALKGGQSKLVRLINRLASVRARFNGKKK